MLGAAWPWATQLKALLEVLEKAHRPVPVPRCGRSKASRFKLSRLSGG